MQHNMAVLIRFLIFLTLLTLPLSAAPSKTKAMQELAKNAPYQEGAKAMDGELPDIAIGKFREVLTNKKLGADAKAFTNLALAEALIRSSLSNQGDDRQASDALDILDSKELSEIPATPIWKAEAYASLGRYQDAEEMLAQIKKTHSLFSHTQLARARIQMALNKNNDAVITLNSLSSSKVTKVKNTANLLAAEIYIDQARFELATKALDNIDSQNTSAAKLKDYLRARLMLSESKAKEAITQFKSLITAPELLSERIFRACVLGLADAQAADEQSDTAINTLIEYISTHPDSTVVEPFFLRLSLLLPEEVPLDHPTLIKLREWSDETLIHENILIPLGDSAITPLLTPPSPDKQNDRATLALYYRAKLLARSTNEVNHIRALALFRRLRALQPSQYTSPNELYLKLSSASLLDTAYLHLKQKNTERATYTLAAMEKVAFSPELKDRASYLRGFLLAKELRYDEALAAFNFARLSSSSDIASAASINAGIMSLISSNLKAFEKIAASHEKQKDLRISLLLERALWKSSVGDLSSRNDLESFIIAHPNHVRENEARLALASACVDIAPADLILAKAQLELISPRLPEEADQLTITRIGIRAEELSQDWTAAIAIADAYISIFPESENLPSILLKKGEVLYHNEDFNASRRVFQDIANKYPKSELKPFADFYAAMAARLGGTTQSREECITMFQKIIESKSTLANEARIQQSRILIDLRRYSDAEKALTPLKKSKQSAIRRDAGILLADCLHRQGAIDSSRYEAAVEIYNNLLTEKNLPRSWNHRIHYLRGQTYESMKLRGKALDSYLDVILRVDAKLPNAEESEEWFWFYRCGFKALAMLETDKRWEAAVKLARRISEFKGPRAEEAKKRAINLANTHMIWVD